MAPLRVSHPSLPSKLCLHAQYEIIETLLLQPWVVFFLDVSCLFLGFQRDQKVADRRHVDDFGVTSSVMVMHPFQVYFAPLTPGLKVRVVCVNDMDVHIFI